jgi:hypothetical protein
MYGAGSLVTVSKELYKYKSSLVGVQLGRWEVGGTKSHIVVPNDHATTEDKIADVKVSLHEELERVLNNLPKYHMNFLLGDFSTL